MEATDTMEAIDLHGFCMNEPSMYAIDKPWLAGGKTYATDGRIAIRVDAELPGVSAPNGKVPDVPATLDPMSRVTEWRSVPRRAQCDKCNGVGRRLWTCEICNCVGWYFQGHRFFRCESCDEITEPRDDDTFMPIVCGCKTKFANRMLGTFYVNLIRELPDAQMGVANASPGNPIYFKFSNGVGVLMPIASDDE